MTKIELDTQATNNGSNRKRENQSFYEVLLTRFQRPTITCLFFYAYTYFFED